MERAIAETQVGHHETPRLRPRITVKALAELNMPGVCERSFGLKWLLSQQQRVDGRQYPFQMGFPGVFFSIDSLAKNSVRTSLAETGNLPSWFPDVGFKVIGYLPPSLLHWSKFRAIDGDTGIQVSTVPDEILIIEGGRHLIIDYKTARVTDIQDALLPLYTAQLNIEASLGIGIGLVRPAGLGLLYTEPVTDRNGFNGSLALPLQPTWRPVAMDLTLPQRLLGRAKSIMDVINAGSLPPACDGCADCALLERLLEVLEGLNGGL